MADLERVMESNPMAEEVALTLMLYSMPRPLDQVEAFGVCQGMGEYWRVVEPAGLYQKGLGKHFLIAGNGIEEKTAVQMSADVLGKPPFNLTRTAGVHCQSDASRLHTGLQTAWILAKIQELGIKSLALFVSPYHCDRAFRTLLKAFLKTETPWIPLIPVPVTVSPDTTIPESGATAWESVPGEVKRIGDYQKDVANYRETREYISWFWANAPLFKT